VSKYFSDLKLLGKRDGRHLGGEPRYVLVGKITALSMNLKLSVNKH